MPGRLTCHRCEINRLDRSIGVLLLLQLAPQLDTTSRIHLQESHRRPSQRRQSNDLCLFDGKVRLPYVEARVKQSDNRPGLGIDAGEICTFECVAATTRPSKIAGIISTAMLLGDNMFNMERQ